MMKTKQLLLLSFIFILVHAKAQLSGGFESNSSYYIDDSKIKLEEIEAKNRFRSNNYIRLDYKYKHFTTGIQLESYAPKALLNYSPNFKDAGLGSYN